VQALLCFPRDVPDLLGHGILSLAQRLTDTGWMSIVPGRLYRYPPHMSIAALRDGASLLTLPAGMLARDQPGIGHQLPGRIKPGDVSQFGHQRRRGHYSNTTQGLQCRHEWGMFTRLRQHLQLLFQSLQPGIGLIERKDTLAAQSVGPLSVTPIGPTTGGV